MSFVGILLAMGIHRLLSLRDYWSQHTLLGVPGITSGMSRNRFLELLSNLHLNDNDKMPARDSPLFDKLYKSTATARESASKYTGTLQPHQQVSVNEAMILFKGHSTLNPF